MSANETLDFYASYPNVIETGGLRPYVPTPQYMLAMKCMAMRAAGVDGAQDVEDIKHLTSNLRATYPGGGVCVGGTVLSRANHSTKVRFGIEERASRPELRMGGARPSTLAEVATITLRHPEEFDAATREFLDAYWASPIEARGAMLRDEPAPTGNAVKDAYLGALAEHLAGIAGEAAPEWCANRSRFLAEPFFATGLESLKAILLVESPTAFRRRMLVGRDVASRA